MEIGNTVSTICGTGKIVQKYTDGTYQIKINDKGPYTGEIMYLTSQYIFTNT